MIESKGYKITPIDGDLAVSRNAEVGGDVDIHGKARVAGSLKVEGFLDAPNIKGVVKGLFATEEELKREYPNPRPGWCAIVLADDERGFLYLAKNREWKKQSEEAKPFDFIVDSINVFASKGELADETQRAQSAEGKLQLNIEEEAATRMAAVDEIKGKAALFGTFAPRTDAEGVLIKYENINHNVGAFSIPVATEEKAGVMTAADKAKLDAELNIHKINKPSLINFNEYIEQGIYNFHCYSDAINSPINSKGEIKGRLTVLSTYQQSSVITQVLNINNNAGGDGNIYIRSCQNGEWKPWAKLQTNVEVGVVNQEQLDALVDNGIYSGILSTTGETFVIICINNYAIAQQVGVQHISHLKYSLVVGTGEVKIEKRTRDAYGFWTEWENIGGSSNVYDTVITEIISRAVDADSFNVEQEIDGVRIDFATLDDGAYSGDITIHAATISTAGVMSAEDKRMQLDINSRLGHGAETIVLKASDLVPMTWNGTKMVSSTNFNVWIVSLNEGVQYSVKNTPFIQSRRTCSEYPALGTELPMTTISSSTFTATSKMKYLVITVTMSVYDGSDYELSAIGHGLINEFNSLKTHVNETYELSKNTQNHLLQTESELSACIGSKDRTIILTSNDYDNLLWTGTSFAKANSTYNGFVVPIYPGERIRYTARQANNVCTLTDYPTIGSSERVRTKADFNNEYAKGDFIVQDNEHYLFLNATVASLTSYEVIGGRGSVAVQIDDIRQVQTPLYGKTIVCFGDSLTEFNGIEGKGYGDYLAELSGAKVIRGGIGGTQLATRKEPVETIPDTDIAYQHAYGAVDISNLVKAWANNDWVIVDNAIAWLAENKNDNNSAVIERLKANPIENTDIVIVFGGSNDLNNSTFGSPNDTDAIKNTCGGINQIIDSILSVKPDMTIYFFTPIPRMATSEIWCDDYRTDQSDAHGSLSFPSLVKRIKECVEYNHIPCCDMYNTIGINRKNIYTYADDGVHPNHGYSMLANKMYGFILANRIWN